MRWHGHLGPEHLELAPAGAELGDTIELVLTWARAHDIDLAGLTIAAPSLEDAYLELTDGAEPPPVHAHA